MINEYIYKLICLMSINLLNFRILGNLPNTYIFSKSLAEHVVKDLGQNLPIVIIRPSIGKKQVKNSSVIVY